MTVITMSTQIGSGADEVAERLCADLGLVAFDKRLMVRVAADLGVSESEIVDYSEVEYRRRGFFDALFRRSRQVAEVSSWAGGRADSGYERQVRVLDEYRAVDLIRATVNAAYDRGDVLIVGRGGQAILEDRPGVFHVRIVAPYEFRVYRLVGDRSISPPQARRLVTERDEAKREYLRTFHHVDVDDPSLYHLVLNAGKLGVEGCVELIKAGLKAMTAAAPAEPSEAVEEG